MTVNRKLGSSSRKHARKVLGVLISAALASPQAWGAVAISSSPLLTAIGVAPNVLFVLDDSGSMQWDRMPEDTLLNTSNGSSGSGHGYLFPVPAVNGSSYGTYYGSGSSNYDDNMPNFNDATPDNVHYRSSQVNVLFYDPLIDYEPWQSYDGTKQVPYFAGLGGGKIDPHAAPWNPARPEVGTLDLTIHQTTLKAEWYGSSCGTAGSTTICGFWPTTFYRYVGAETTRSKILVAPLSDFRKYQIRDGAGFVKDLSSGVETAVTEFDWGGGKIRTVADEQQNFANWFSYYRSRVLAAKAGASIAFAELGDKYRIGFTTINNPGSAGKTVATPISGGFSGSARTAWFSTLLNTPIPAQGTPLRSALVWAGDYYSAKKSVGGSTYDPWLPAGEAECRQSFTIMTTDGYWSSETVSVPSKDGSDGSLTIPNDLGGTATGYKAVAPYADSVSTVTMGDIANYYWKTDLRPLVANKVSSKTDPAYWQHMATFTLSFGVQGTLKQRDDLSGCVEAGDCPVWPDPAAGDPQKIDDLWHAAVNGHGKFVAAQNPDEFKKGLVESLRSINQITASAASLSGNSTSVTAGSTVFQGTYVAKIWTGDLVAWSLNETDGSVQSPAKWSAAEKMPSHGSRNIFTRVGGVGKAFVDSDSAVVGALGAASPTEGANLVNYIRGDQSKESSTGFRVRDSVLGDIVNSSPAFVGVPLNKVYDRTSVPGHADYTGFRSDNAKRHPIVYVGANDGMLHAFDAKTGTELFAYVPQTVLPKLKNLAKQDYEHQFFVDGSVVAEDVYIGGKWRTIVICALGLGGDAIFALDVTDPVTVDADGNVTSVKFDPATDVLWELSGGDFGNFTSIPIAVPMNDGKWAVAVGNGYNGSSGKGFLYVINAADGSVIAKLATNGNLDNGLAGAGGWDDNRDGIADLLYAGDLYGEMWKFDVSSASPADWAATATDPIFVAVDPADATKPQPITAPPIIGAHPDTGERWVFFGTGKFIADADRSDTSIQTWYGLRDVNPKISGRTELVERVITKEIVEEKGIARVLSDVVAGDLVDSTGTYVKQGWYIDLLVGGKSGVKKGERMLTRNTLLKDVLLGETLTPNNTACGDLGDGWLLVVNPWLGGRPTDDFFDTNVDGTVDTDDHVDSKTKTASGWKLGNGGIPYMQHCGDGYCMTTTAPKGDTPPETTHAASGLTRGRQSWRELMGE